MRSLYGFFFLLSLSTLLSAQQSLVHVNLDRWAKDERFGRMMNPVAFCYTAGDTILAYDMENHKEPVRLLIRRPAGYKSYAYGYVFFSGVPNPRNPGMMNLLLVNVQDRHPLLYIDRNNNLDFTDDGNPLSVPVPYNYKDSVRAELGRTDETGGGIAIQFSRMNFSNRYAYRNMLNEHYDYFYHERSFVGIDYCLREQRFTTRSGVFRTETDSFTIALYDANSNGLYNDQDTDKVIIGNYSDQIFDARDELHAFTLSKHKSDQYIERNGAQYEMLQVDPAGKFMVLKQADSAQLFDKIPAGKKVPKFAFTDWEGKRYKITKFKRKQVFIYYGGTHSPGFMQDTTALRKIAADYKDRITVIGFIDVQKSYELRIFGTYANLNWIASFRDKYVIQDLKLRGLPSSLWLAKKRKVIRYNLTPQQLLDELMSIK